MKSLKTLTTDVVAFFYSNVRVLDSIRNGNSDTGTRHPTSHDVKSAHIVEIDSMSPI